MMLDFTYNWNKCRKGILDYNEAVNDMMEYVLEENGVLPAEIIDHIASYLKCNKCGTYYDDGALCKRCLHVGRLHGTVVCYHCFRLLSNPSHLPCVNNLDNLRKTNQAIIGGTKRLLTCFESLCPTRKNSKRKRLDRLLSLYENDMLLESYKKKKVT